MQSNKKISDVMSDEIVCLSEKASIQECAQKMRDKDIGAIPVVDANDRFIGMVTDRDITIRVTAEGKDPARTTCRDAMSSQTFSCSPDASFEDAVHLMESKEVRRLAVCDDQNHVLGIVSLGDVASNSEGELKRELLEHVAYSH